MILDRKTLGTHQCYCYMNSTKCTTLNLVNEKPNNLWLLTIQHNMSQTIQAHLTTLLIHTISLDTQKISQFATSIVMTKIGKKFVLFRVECKDKTTMGPVGLVPTRILIFFLINII